MRRCYSVTPDPEHRDHELDPAHAYRLQEWYRDMISITAIKQRRKAREEEDDGQHIRRPAGLPPERS